MNVKIQCGCGTKYALDITPAHARSGVRLVCQTCGRDNSEPVNQIIRETFSRVGILESAPSSTDESLPVAQLVAAASPPAAESAPPPAFVTPPPPTSAAVARAAAPCLKHPGYTYTSQCVVCQKPLCPKCLEQFGYLCSAYCKGKAEDMRIAVPAYAGQRVAVERTYWRKVRVAVWSLSAVVMALLALWTWYAFVGSRPRVAWSVKLPVSDYGGYCKLVTQNQLLVWHGDKLARYDLEQRREVWSTPLLDKGQLAEQATNWLAQYGSDAAAVILGKRDWRDPPKSNAVQLSDVMAGLRAGFALDLKVRVAGDAAWILFPDRLVRYDWQTGQAAKSIPVEDRLVQFDATDTALFLITRDDLGRERLIRVDARSGDVRQEQVPTAPPANRTRKNAEFAGDAEAGVFIQETRAELLNARRNFVFMSVNLVEAKTAQYKAMEDRSGKSALDGDVNVTSTAAVANEIMNDWQRERTGGMRFEDESRYAVTLKRILSEDAAADWAGEVVGAPEFYALENVDILAAGRVIQVFDKANKKLWQSTLGFSIAQRAALDRDPYAETPEAAPALERGDRLYFFDPGVLTCFELQTGKVLWRLQSVGISKVQFDPQGMLYVTTTSAGVDALRHSQQVDVTRRVLPLILKVDPANGKILWDVPRRADACRFSGEFIYAIQATKGGGGSLTKLPVPEHSRIYRLEPDTGRALWEHFDQRMPLSWDCAQNCVLLLFRDELQMLNFISL